MRISFLLFILLIGIQASAAELGLERSQRIPMTAQLQKESLPWFVARNRNDTEPFSRKNLEALVKPQTKRVALVFFATWCLPCREGIAILRNNQAELAQNGVQIVLVNTGETNLPEIEKWVKTLGDEKWLVIIDKFKNIQNGTGIISEAETTLPKTILMDNKLKPLLLIGAEGKDWPTILWE
jgi:thiol-disulfide isomerase/thioredoxin